MEVASGRCSEQPLASGFGLHCHAEGRLREFVVFFGLAKHLVGLRKISVSHHFVIKLMRGFELFFGFGDLSQLRFQLVIFSSFLLDEAQQHLIRRIGCVMSKPHRDDFQQVAPQS